jgi:hypothetical protein
VLCTEIIAATDARWTGSEEVSQPSEQKILVVSRIIWLLALLMVDRLLLAEWLRIMFVVTEPDAQPGRSSISRSMFPSALRGTIAV